MTFSVSQTYSLYSDSEHAGTIRPLSTNQKSSPDDRRVSSDIYLSDYRGARVMESYWAHRMPSYSTRPDQIPH